MRPEQVQDVLDKPLAQELMATSIPARLAYTGTDGFPRVVPIGYLWNGAAFAMCTTVNAPKLAALRARPEVALTVDTENFPPHLLLVRGRVSKLETVTGVAPEFLEMSKPHVPAEQWPAFESEVRSLYAEQVRISITPEWAKLIDFETTLPQPVEELVKSRALSDGTQG